MKSANSIMAMVVITLLTVLQLLSIAEYEHKYVRAPGNPFKAKTIVIDPGHGGVDGGASLGEHFHEKDINLDVSLKLKELLVNAGAEVVLTRDSDVSLENRSDLQSSRYRRDLDARRDIVNNSGAAVFISIHTNCFRSNPKTKGAIVFYHYDSEEGEKLARLVGGSIDGIVYRDFLKSNTLEAKVLPESLFMLRSTEIPGILVETGYMTNAEEGMLLKQDAYQKIMAEALLEGLRHYFTVFFQA